MGKDALTVQPMATHTETMEAPHAQEQLSAPAGRLALYALLAVANYALRGATVHLSFLDEKYGSEAIVPALAFTIPISMIVLIALQKVRVSKVAIVAIAFSTVVVVGCYLLLATPAPV